MQNRNQLKDFLLVFQLSFKLTLLVIEILVKEFVRKTSEKYHVSVISNRNSNLSILLGGRIRYGGNRYYPVQMLSQEVLGTLFCWGLWKTPAYLLHKSLSPIKKALHQQLVMPICPQIPRIRYSFSVLVHADYVQRSRSLITHLDAQQMNKIRLSYC